MAEPYAGGTFNANMGGGRFRSAFNSLRCSSASATLKFDIPGLQQFRREIDQIRDALTKLQTTFQKLASSPKGFADQLKVVNEQLKQMKSNMPTGGMGGIGTTPSFMPTGQAQPGVPAGWVRTVMSPNALPPGGGGGGPPGGGGGGGGGGLPPGMAMAGGMAAGGGLSGLVEQGITAMGNRFDRGAAIAAQMDVFGSRS